MRGPVTQQGRQAGQVGIGGRRIAAVVRAEFRDGDVQRLRERDEDVQGGMLRAARNLPEKVLALVDPLRQLQLSKSGLRPGVADPASERGVEIRGWRGHGDIVGGRVAEGKCPSEIIAP